MSAQNRWLSVAGALVVLMVGVIQPRHLASTIALLAALAFLRWFYLWLSKPEWNSRRTRMPLYVNVALSIPVLLLAYKVPQWLEAPPPPPRDALEILASARTVPAGGRDNWGIMWHRGMTDVRVDIHNKEADAIEKLDLYMELPKLGPSGFQPNIWQLAQTTKTRCELIKNPDVTVHGEEMYEQRPDGKWERIERKTQMWGNNLRITCDRLYGNSTVQLVVAVFQPGSVMGESFNGVPETLFVKGSYEVNGSRSMHQTRRPLHWLAPANL